MPIGSSPSGLAQAAQSIPPNHLDPFNPDKPDFDPNTLNPDFNPQINTLDPMQTSPKGLPPSPLNQLTPLEQLDFAHAMEMPIAYSQPTPAQIAAALNAFMSATQKGWDAISQGLDAFGHAQHGDLTAPDAPEAPPGWGWGNPTPTQAPTGYMDAFNAPQNFADALNSTLAAMNPAPQEAAVTAAPDAEAPSMGYGYGLNMGNPDANAPAPGSVAAALAEAQGYADSQAAPTGYGYGLSLGAPASEGEDDGGDDGGDDAGDAGDGGDGGY